MANDKKTLQEEFEQSLEDMSLEGAFLPRQPYEYNITDINSNSYNTQDFTGTGEYIYTGSSTITIGSDTTLDSMVFPTEESRNGNLMAINERLDTIERHLGVLTNKPSQETLDKYEALKNAYNEYKLIEKICLSGKDADGED